MMRNRTTVKLQPGLFLQPFVVSQLVGAIIDRVVEGSGIAASEFAVASSVAAFGSVTPTELARALGLSPTTLSAMVDRLVRKQQLRRVRHPDDGRSYVLELTSRGKATNARNARRFAAELQALRGHLEGDADEVLDAMRRLEVALRQTLGG
jgi:DNA-binding MarR family transcriptional regulator